MVPDGLQGFISGSGFFESSVQSSEVEIESPEGIWFEAKVEGPAYETKRQDIILGAASYALLENGLDQLLWKAVHGLRWPSAWQSHLASQCVKNRRERSREDTKRSEKPTR
jgi:hypothetical protein